MKPSYLLIQHLSVKRANALATPYLINAAPVFAASMFAHALLVSIDPGLKHVGTVYVHHDAQILYDRMPNSGKNGGYYETSHLSLMKGACTIASRNGKGEYDSKAYARSQPVIATQPHALAHIEISLVIAFKGVRPPVTAIKEEVSRRRVAGGHIEDLGDISYCDTVGEALYSLGNGYVLMDRSDLLSGQQDKIKALLNVCSRRHDETKEGLPTDTKTENAWCVPAVLGYAMLTPFVKRTGTRNIHGSDKMPLHAYAEPLVAPVQFRSFRRTKISAVGEQNLMWHYEWLDDNVFRITQQQNTQEEI